MEEYSAEKHDKFLAERTQLYFGDKKAFDKLQMKIASDNHEGRNLTDSDYNDEIDLLMKIDPAHYTHFSRNRPTVEEWKKRRSLYVDTDHSRIDWDDLYDKNKQHTFNSLTISVYIREPAEARQHLEQLKQKLRDSIPGYDLETYHMSTFHDEAACIKEDVFGHKNSFRYADIEKVERKHPYTEDDLTSGKYRWDPKKGENQD